MTCNGKPTVGYVTEDGGASFLARLVGHSGSNVTQASLSAITVKVFDMDSADPDTEVYSETLTISSVIFDTLQTDSRWTVDTTGYNFLHAMSATAFPTGGHNYRVEYKFTPASGQVFWALFDVLSTNIQTS